MRGDGEREEKVRSVGVTSKKNTFLQRFSPIINARLTSLYYQAPGTEILSSVLASIGMEMGIDSLRVREYFNFLLDYI